MHKIADGLLPLAVDIDEPVLLKKNPRRGKVDAVAKLLEKFGQRKPITVHSVTMVVLTGNHTLMAARKLGWTQIAALFVDDDPTMAKAWTIADNRVSELGDTDQDALIDMLADISEEDEELLDVISYSMDDIEVLLASAAPLPLAEPPPAPELETAAEHDWDADKLPEGKSQKVGLADRFLVPPFSVLNAREGWWQDRKREWIDLGIEGELGREDKPRTWYLAPPERHSGGVVPEGSADRRADDGVVEGVDGLLYGAGSTSIFDPVLTELVYRWFSPPGGHVLDPCAGGSVRGIVAAKLGRPYTGIELRQNQVDANERQRDEILADGHAIVPDVPRDSMPEFTPIERHGNIWMKREDLYTFAGVRGAKVRTCLHFIERAKASEKGVVTAGSRQSPQVNFVAQIANRLDVPCRVHVPSGELTPEVLAARGAGAKVIQHENGYNTVIIARAREDAEERGWIEVPFGMESQEAVDFTKPQVPSVFPEGVSRIINACGSGMTLAGILWGLVENEIDIPVVAICVSRAPTKRLDEWAPPNWREMVTLIEHPIDYHIPASGNVFDGVILDPYYEAKCIDYLEDDDLLWVSAIRPSAVPAVAPSPTWICGDGQEAAWLLPEGTRADLVFTCPPYGDLEVYSDDARDLSTMKYDDFIQSFAVIMSAAWEHLNDDSFAVLVVGDYRDRDGYFHNFPGDVIRFMQEIGYKYLNEAVLVTKLSSLPIRVGRQFDISRKMGKTHQQCLTFVKGDAKRAAGRCGPIVSADTLGE
jgi:hypothetical protein